MKELEKIINAVIDLKIPSLLILVIFGVFGYLLLKDSPSINSTNGIAGLLCIGVMLLSGVYAFFDQKIKENYEKIISTQQTAMDSLSKTHSVFEKNQRDSLNEKSQYTKVGEVSSTETNI